MRRSQWACGDYQAAVRTAHECSQRAFDPTLVTHIDCAQFDAKRWCDGLDGRELAYSGSDGRIPNYGCPLQIRGKLLQQLQPLRANAVLEHCKSGRVSARVRHTFDDIGSDRIND